MATSASGARHDHGGTPALLMLQAARVRHTVHGFDHDPRARSFGAEAAEVLGIDPYRICKTLIVATGERRYAVAVIPVAASLDLKACADALGVKRVAMADVRAAERVSGYVHGGISPLGQRHSSATVVDEAVSALSTVFVSAGRRGLQVALDPVDLIRLTKATVAAVAAGC